MNMKAKCGEFQRSPIADTRSRLHKIAVTVTVTVAVIAAFVVPPTTARAIPPVICDAEHEFYRFSNVRTDAVPTNLHSEWAEAGFKIDYTQSTTATANVATTATVGADVDAILAKVSTSIGVTVGRSWSEARLWHYSAPSVPKNQEGRIVMYRQSRAFLVTKMVLHPPCKYVPAYTNAAVNAPVKAGDENIFRMQLRSASAQQPSGSAQQVTPSGFRKKDENYFEKEIDLPRQP